MTDLDSDEDKLNWIFTAFGIFFFIIITLYIVYIINSDQDGGGFIDRKE